MYKFLFLLLLILSGLQVAAQTGSIEGLVTDKELNNQPLPFADVVIKGTNSGTSTDLDGKYNFRNLEPGIYTLIFSFIGYETQEVANVEVFENKKTVIDVSLGSGETTLDNIVIRVTKRTNTESAVLLEVKEAKQIVSAISAEQIQKSTDSNAAEAIQRVPGVTIVEGKFVMIRGLSERYNNTLINSAFAPSTEVDRRTFSFDLIPANTLDKMVIHKTGAAYLPGDFAGGVIKLSTSENFSEFTTLSFDFGYRANTTFQDYFQSEGSPTDFLGFDNGFRQLPNNFPSQPSDFFDNQVSTDAAALLPNNFNPTSSTSFLDTSIGFGMGRKIKLNNDATIKTVNALSYSNSFLNYDMQNNKYFALTGDQERPQVWSTFNDRVYTNKVRMTLMSNWIYSWDAKNTIKFKNLFNQIGENQTILREGFDFQQREGDLLNNYLLGYSSRSIYTGQFEGKHFLGDNQTIDWLLGANYISDQEPDLRRFRTFRRIDRPEDPFTMIDPPSSNLFDTGRFYGDLSEFSVNNGLNYTYELKRESEEEDFASIILKTGYYTDYRSRDFSARYVSFLIPGYITQDRKQELTQLPLTDIFSPENVNPVDGWVLREGTTPRDQYSASNFLMAGYAYAEVPLGKFDLTGGVRLEHNILQLEGNDGSRPLSVDQPITSLLPSVNLGYNINEKTVYRLAYSRTVNRPEFREIAPFLFYDFELDAEKIGNENLTTATIDNFDMRYEFYPNKGETVSIGGFYKYFNNPIETISPIVSEQRRFTYINSDNAYIYGAELELRKSFHDWSKNPILQKLSANLNASYIFSRVDLGDSALSEQGEEIQDQKRALQGQSPYIVNLALNYEDKEREFMVNVVYNRFGDRIFSVGNTAWRTIYELSRDQVDLNISKTFGKVTYRFSVTDLLNAKFRFYEDSNIDGKIRSSDDNIIYGFRRGTLFNFNVLYNF